MKKNKNETKKEGIKKMRKINKGTAVKIMSMGLAVAIAAGSIVNYNVNAKASVKNETALECSANESMFTQEEYNMIEEYMVFDETTSSYVYEKELENVVSNEELAEIENILEETNETVRCFDLKSEEVVVVDATNCNEIKQGNNVTRIKYKEGKDKVETHWYGLKVFLSKKTVRRIGTGATIGGIWIPEPIVSKVVATLGVVASTCPGGVWFVINPLLLANPVLSSIAFATGKTAGFQ